MIILVLIVIGVFVQVFGKMFIEIVDDVDKRNRKIQEEKEFQRHLTESIRKGQRRN